MQFFQVGESLDSSQIPQLVETYIQKHYVGECCCSEQTLKRADIVEAYIYNAEIDGEQAQWVILYTTAGELCSSCRCKVSRECLRAEESYMTL